MGYPFHFFPYEKKGMGYPSHSHSIPFYLSSMTSYLPIFYAFSFTIKAQKTSKILFSSSFPFKSHKGDHMLNQTETLNVMGTDVVVYLNKKSSTHQPPDLCLEEHIVSLTKQIPLCFNIKKQFVFCITFLMLLLVIV